MSSGKIKKLVEEARETGSQHLDLVERSLDAVPSDVLALEVRPASRLTSLSLVYDFTL